KIIKKKEMKIKKNKAIIKSIVETFDANPNVDLEPMIKMALGLNKQTILDYTQIEFDFDQKTNEKFEEKYTDANDVIEFYWQWKQLTLEAVFYKLNNTSA